MSKKSERATVSLTPEEMDAIKMISKSEERAVSQVISRMVRAYLHGGQLIPGNSGNRKERVA